MTRRARRLLNGAIGAAVLVLASPLVAPQLLAFPYHATSNGSEIWSEAPLPQAEIDRVTARAAKLVAESPIALPSEPRHVFLTRGGWRWTWLALQSRGAFGVTRAVGGAVLINRSDLAADRAFNGARVRTLSGVIAHETCHGIERRRFGVIKSDILAPQWLREGYCDYVAQESTLTAADVARLEASGRDDPALAYYRGRKRVSALLATDGGNIDALFD